MILKYLPNGLETNFVTASASNPTGAQRARLTNSVATTTNLSFAPQLSTFSISSSAKMIGPNFLTIFLTVTEVTDVPLFFSLLTSSPN